MAIRSMLACGFVGVAALVTACTASTEDSVAQPESSTLDPQSAKVQDSDSGTWLKASLLSAGAGQCTADGEASITLSASLTSTASRAPADVLLYVDGILVSTLYDDIAPSDFVTSGRNKLVANYTTSTATLPAGEHTVQLCFEQPSGKLRMRSCTDVQTVFIDCQSGTTCNQTPFGETVGNHNICRGAGDLSVNINAKGDFGESPTLTISGPLGFQTITLDHGELAHSGNSCVYHYRWVPKDSGATTGTYTFKVDGNGHTTQWSKDMFCSTKY